MLELAHTLDAIPEPSPLAEARERRGLSITQVAYRTSLSEDEIEWLEDGRLYRFPSQNKAILAGIVYATAVGIDRFEARRIAGLPVTGMVRVNAKARLIVVGAFAALLSALAVMVIAPNIQLTQTRTVEAIPNANLPPPWKLQVTVENGNGDITWTRTLASRIGAMGYTISKVTRADRFNYPASTVYYGPGGQDVGIRLARQLAVSAQQTPGLTARQLLVIVGPQTVAATTG
ncbi:MAG TPA: helix-turn-helix domain-containing protein [Gaiellaceae bacterium]|nr:helix-turn-helix domain-containing protein [Gaiellaceae bacterium]